MDAGRCSADVYMQEGVACGCKKVLRVWMQEGVACVYVRRCSVCMQEGVACVYARRCSVQVCGCKKV